MKFEVLIVDDDKMIVMVHKMIILKSNFHANPLSFPNGKEALDYILDNHESDKTYCIFLDINMPLMNGWEFLDAISLHNIKGRILVFMATSSVDKFDKEKAKKYREVIGFLKKPISVSRLEELKKNESLKIFFDE